eukprot:COSAG01_NODE_37587_length_501_cov_1.835821_1_plen_32_part_01
MLTPAPFSALRRATLACSQLLAMTVRGKPVRV